MLLPDSMSRVLVVGVKDQLKDTIDILYNLENTHVIDFSSEEDGFSLGKPLPAASDASEKLLRLRSAEKDLEIDDSKVEARLPVREVEKDLNTSLTTLGSEITKVSEAKTIIQQSLANYENQRKALEPFVAIPLDLELYKGYTNLRVLAGSVRADPSNLLNESLHDFELFKSKDSDFIALFVKKSEADEAQRILIQNGFTEVAIPEGQGRPEAIIKEIETNEADLRKQLEEVSGQLDSLREKYAAIILASDEHLSIIVEKAETPLRFGESEHSFVIEAWVPAQEVAKVQSALNSKFHDNIYLEVLETESRKDEHESREEHKTEAGVFTAEAVTKPMKEETPVKTEHRKTGRRFEFFTRLISTPRYNEIDPTITIAIFFPLFFGLMVGDVGYGIPFVILGYLGLKRSKSPEWRGIATMLFYGGIWSIIFGLFLFGDMMGIEFTHFRAGAEGITWSDLLGLDLPHSILNLGVFNLQLGYYAKLESVTILLWISVWIGIFHLLLGLCLGFYNITIRHGIKDAVTEKFSWIMILVGGALLLLWMVNGLILNQGMSLTDPMFIIALALIIVGVVIAVRAEGGKAIIELPGLMSNVLSYTRLTAIGLSKAGIALAFNTIALTMIAPLGGVYLIFALLVFILGHLMIFILAIISAGLHGIRLQYVELFGKFYEGGGLDFNPLRIIRKYTTTEE